MAKIAKTVAKPVKVEKVDPVKELKARIVVLEKQAKAQERSVQKLVEGLAKIKDAAKSSKTTRKVVVAKTEKSEQAAEPKKDKKSKKTARKLKKQSED